MPEDLDISQIRSRAHDLLRSGMIGSDIVVTSGHMEMPIAVHAPDHRHHSWFVPVTVGDRLIAFLQLWIDGTPMRFSSFQRRAGTTAACPAAVDWLDPNQIQKRAEIQRQSDEKSGEPFLTYDGSPDRLVWAVPLTNARGHVRLVYVLGETVYAVPSEGKSG